MRALLLPIFVAALHAQTSAPAASILEEARAQPIEIFADIAFQLLPHLSPAAKVSVLTEIFERAGEARKQFPTRYPDVTALDALSLRTRAIRTMLPLDGRKGRDLFDSMVRPNVPQTTCEEAAAPDASVYMDMVEAVFRQGEFTAKEREKGVPWKLVIDAVRGAGSASEIASAAQRLTPHAHTEREQAELTSALASALAVQDSDRGFTSAPPSRLVGSIVSAGSFLRRTNQLPLLSALRNYLVRHLTASRCEAASRASPDGADEFNEAVISRGDIFPLSADETKSIKREGKPSVRPVDPGYLALERRLRTLSSKPGGDAGRARSTPDGSDQSLTLLAEIESWHGAESQDSMEVSRDKLKLFTGMAVAASGGVSYRGAIAGALSILGDSTILLQAPEAWVSELRSLLMLSRAKTALRAVQARTSPDPPPEPDREIPQQLTAAKLPALTLYGRLLLLGPR